MSVNNDNTRDLYEEEPENLISEVAGLHRIYLYRPYTYHRIRRILLKYFNIEMVYLNQGYKANRKPGFCERYDLVEKDTREVIAKFVSLDQCRRVLAYYDFPEEDEYSAGNTPHDWKRREFNRKLEELKEKERMSNEEKRN